MEVLFRPWLGERVAMSPDGHYLAYTQHVGHDLTIVVKDLETLKQAVRIIADEDRPVLHSAEKRRASLRFLGWADGKHLVFAPPIENVTPTASPLSADFYKIFRDLAGEAEPPPPPTMLGAKFIAPVMVVDADGKNPREILKASDFEGVPGTLVGFGTGKLRNRLLVCSINPGEGQAFVITGVDAATGKRTVGAGELIAGEITFNWQGEPRLAAQTMAGETGRQYLYRVPGTKRWQPLPNLAPGVSFEETLGNEFGPRAIPLGFDFDPNVLIYAANAGRDTFGIYGLNLQTHERTSLALELPVRDLVPLGARPGIMGFPGLIYDRHREQLAGVRTLGPRAITVWRDPELAQVQREIEAKFPPSTISILDWNADRTRFLMQVVSGSEPKRIGLYRRPEGKLVELVRGAPWLQDAEMHTTEYVEFSGPDRSTLTGYLTLPKMPRLNPPPLIVWLAGGFPLRPHPEFDPQALTLADMGFVVLRLNNRGVLGFGARARDALRRDPDHVAAADAVAAIKWVAANHPVDHKRVVALGDGFGGYLAVRVAQLQPDDFRCAVAMDPILNFANWLHPLPNDAVGSNRIRDRLTSFTERIHQLYLEGEGMKLSDLSVVADELRHPVFVASREPLDAKAAAIAAGVTGLKAALQHRNLDCVTITYNEDYALGLPAARARVYRALEEFFNLNLYHYDVKIGPTRVVK